MRNNFNFNASIKLKDLEKMKRIYEVLRQEKVENKGSRTPADRL